MSLSRSVFVSLLVVLAGCASQSASRDRPPSDADAAVANMNLGAGYLRQGRPELAIERLQRALELNPRLADAHSTIAIAYDQIGSADDAETHYRRATQLDPNNSSAANAYAVFLCRQNRWRDAEPYFKRAVANASYATPEAALTNAGVCAMNGGDEAKAEENFRAALMRNPQFADALAGMLELTYRAGKYAQAQPFLERYMAARPASAQVLLRCVDIEGRLGNREAADRCAADLRRNFPGSPEIGQLQGLQSGNGRE